MIVFCLRILITQYGKRSCNLNVHLFGLFGRITIRVTSKKFYVRNQTSRGVSKIVGVCVLSLGYSSKASLDFAQISRGGDLQKVVEVLPIDNRGYRVPVRSSPGVDRKAYRKG